MGVAPPRAQLTPHTRITMVLAAQIINYYLMYQITFIHSLPIAQKFNF